MFRMVKTPGFTFPYPVEYLFTGAVLVGIASVVVVGIVVITIECTVPHIRKSVRKKMLQYRINHMSELERAIYDEAYREGENNVLREYQEAGVSPETIAKIFDMSVEDIKKRLEETAEWVEKVKKRN